jgi:cytochrome c-type biogenesis protein CcsB
MDTLWYPPAIACYAVASVGFITDRLSGGGRWTHPATIALGAGAGFQAVDLLVRGMRAGNIPVANFEESLAFFSWLIALAGLVLIVRFRMAVIGALVGSAVTIGAGVAYVTMRHARLVLPEALRSVWLPIHVTLAFLGYAMFALAAVVSLTYLFYESRLKAKRALAPPEAGLPSLEKLDRINYRLLAWGFLMLSAAIITGAIWADSTWGHFWSWDPKESWSLVIWFMYAALLESRLTVGWRGRRAAALTIVVFTLLVGSFVGVSLVFPGKHSGSFG